MVYAGGLCVLDAKEAGIVGERGAYAVVEVYG